MNADLVVARDARQDLGLHEVQVAIGNRVVLDRPLSARSGRQQHRDDRGNALFVDEIVEHRRHERQIGARIAVRSSRGVFLDVPTLVLNHDERRRRVRHIAGRDVHRDLPLERLMLRRLGRTGAAAGAKRAPSSACRLRCRRCWFGPRGRAWWRRPARRALRRRRAGGARPARATGSSRRYRRGRKDLALRRVHREPDDPTFRHVRLFRECRVWRVRRRDAEVAVPVEADGHERRRVSRPRTGRGLGHCEDHRRVPRRARSRTSGHGGRIGEDDERHRQAGREHNALDHHSMPRSDRGTDACGHKRMSREPTMTSD